MPPPESHRSAHRGAKANAQTLGGRGRGVSAALGIRGADAAGRAGDEGASFGQQSDRCLHSRRAWSARKSDAVAGGGSATLIRRLSLDLTGLPPEPKDVEAFVASRDPRAYEKLVAAATWRRRISANAWRFRGSIWCGLPTRSAFTTTCRCASGRIATTSSTRSTENLPFDQFTREQLAGDLLPDSTITQRVASGYNRLTGSAARAAFRTRSISRNMPRIACAPRRRCGWARRSRARSATTTNSIRSRSRISTRFAAIFADLKEKGAYNLSGGFTRENLTEESIFDTPGQKQRHGGA